MAKYVIDENTLKGIGDAIRAKKGTSDPIPVPNLASEISSIVTKTYNGTIWKFRDNITFDEILAFADEYWQEEFGEYNFSFHTPFTTDVLLEDVDGEYSTQFSSIAMYGDSNYIIVEMYPVNGAATDLAYYDTNSGGEWKNHFTMTLDAEPSAEDLVFLQTFADMVGSADKPDTPTYNGYIPKGTYTITRFAGEDESPNAFESPAAWFKYNGKECTIIYFFDGIIEDVDTESYYFATGDTIEVTREHNVSKAEFDAFMYFCGLRDTISDFSGVIPLGKYVFHPNPDGAVLNLGEQYDEENDDYWMYPDWFTTTDTDGELRTCFGVYCSSGSEEAECYYNPEFMDFLIGDGTVITVITEIEVPKEQYDAFMQYFTPQE